MAGVGLCLNSINISERKGFSALSTRSVFVLFSYPRVTCFVKGPERGVGYHWEQNTTIRYIQSEKAGLPRNKKWKEQWKEGRRKWENEVKDR